MSKNAENTAFSKALDDHLDLMFGVASRKMMTSEHVEVWREPSESGAPYFRKWFSLHSKDLPAAKAVTLTNRESLLLQQLNDKDLPHVQRISSAFYNADRTKKEIVTEHAGPCVEHWLNLPVLHGDQELASVFHDCAHWFGFARFGLFALKTINDQQCLHLDIKEDNICVPVSSPIGIASGSTFQLDLPQLRLIDFAYSLWEPRLPNEDGLGMGICEGSEYQSRQLKDAIWRYESNEPLDLKTLDWRADLHSFAFALNRILCDIPVASFSEKVGWTPERLEGARKLIASLFEYDNAWKRGAPCPTETPHAEFIRELDDILSSVDLQSRLALPFSISHPVGWKAREGPREAPLSPLSAKLRGQPDSTKTIDSPVAPRLDRFRGLLAPLVLAFISGLAYAWLPWQTWMSAPQERVSVPSNTAASTGGSPDEAAVPAGRRSEASVSVVAQDIQGAQLAVRQSAFGSKTWTSHVEKLGRLCKQETGNAVGCSGAFSELQKNYLVQTNSVQKEAWWTQGQFSQEPTPAMRNWLFATQTLAAQGLWVAQVNHAMEQTVAASRTIRELAPSIEARVAAARQLASLVGSNAPPASSFGETVTADLRQRMRSEGADLLWSLHREGEGKSGVALSRQIAPTELVLPVVQSVADMPSQTVQVMYAYSLLCWVGKQTETKALAYFSKAEIAPNNDPKSQATAQIATKMRVAYQSGSSLCKP